MRHDRSRPRPHAADDLSSTRFLLLLPLLALAHCAGTGTVADLDCPELSRIEAKKFLGGEIQAYCVQGDGARHGPWGHWYASGYPEATGYYDRGQRHGVETEWYDPAQLQGWERLRARLRRPRRSRVEWSMGRRHGESTEWDARGRVLERSTWHRGEFVGYARPRGPAEADAELGRPFAALKKPHGCYQRKYFPRLLREMMGEPPDGYSGYEVLYGTSYRCTRTKLPCRNFSHAELSDVMGHPIRGYSEHARFAVRTCATDEDIRRRLAAEEKDWRARSAADEDPGVMAFLADIDGVWCGRSTRVHRGVESHREVRIAFIPGDPDHAALATDTWARKPGGPLGDPGYVISSLLIPRPRKRGDSSSGKDWRAVDIPSTVLFKTICKHDSAGSFTLSWDGQEFVLNHAGHPYPLTQNCEGFWTPPGPDPAVPAASLNEPERH